MSEITSDLIECFTFGNNMIQWIHEERSTLSVKHYLHNITRTTSTWHTTFHMINVVLILKIKGIGTVKIIKPTTSSTQNHPRIMQIKMTQRHFRQYSQKFEKLILGSTQTTRMSATERRNIKQGKNTRARTHRQRQRQRRFSLAQ